MRLQSVTISETHNLHPWTSSAVLNTYAADNSSDSTIYGLMKGLHTSFFAHHLCKISEACVGQVPQTLHTHAAAMASRGARFILFAHNRTIYLIVLCNTLRATLRGTHNTLHVPFRWARKAITCWRKAITRTFESIRAFKTISMHSTVTRIHKHYQKRAHDY